MKKLFILLLLSPFAFPEPNTTIGATCYFYWDSQTDRDKCISSLMKAKNFEDGYLPRNAEMKTIAEYKKKEREDNRGVSDNFITPPPPKQKTKQKATEPKTVIPPSCEIMKQYGTTAQWSECNEKRNKAYKKIWKRELDDSAFSLTSNSNEFFHFMSDGILDGYSMSSTKDEDGNDWGFDMQGAWEVTYGNEDKGYVSIYAGKLECRYSISKKGKLYWFEKIEANYSNICADMLMKRTKLIQVGDPFKD
jgi:hypothetical protein